MRGTLTTFAVLGEPRTGEGGLSIVGCGDVVEEHTLTKEGARDSMKPSLIIQSFKLHELGDAVD